MFQKFLSKYGLGTHLALLTSAPLALTPFLDAASLASVIFWLCALAVVWLLTEPSLRKGEHLSVARRRVRKAVVRDPFFWFLGIAVLFAAFRCLNSGIELRYDPEQTVWLVGESRFGGGPAAVTGAGLLPFAMIVALSIVAMGLRHGIGLKSRNAFGVAGSLFAGIGGLAVSGCACFGLQPFTGWLTAGFGSEPFWASLFGVWLVLGIVTGIQAEVFRWGKARFIFVIGIVGNATALIFFAPPILAVVWLSFAVFVLIFSLFYLSRAYAVGAVARMLSIAIFGFALPVMLVMMFLPESVRDAKLNGFDMALAFPETYKQSFEALSRISRQMSMINPWFGVGDGAFSLHVPFLAEKADWMVLPPQPKFSLNGYWNLLAERGFLGCLIAVIGLVMLFVTYFRRLVRSFMFLRGQDDADIFVFAVPPVAWCPVFVVLLLAGEAVLFPLFRADALFLTVLAVLSLSAAAFPQAKKTVKNESNVNDLEN